MGFIFRFPFHRKKACRARWWGVRAGAFSSRTSRSVDAPPVPNEAFGVLFLYKFDQTLLLIRGRALCFPRGKRSSRVSLVWKKKQLIYPHLWNTQGSLEYSGFGFDSVSLLVAVERLRHFWDCSQVVASAYALFLYSDTNNGVMFLWNLYIWCSGWSHKGATRQSKSKQLLQHRHFERKKQENILVDTHKHILYFLDTGCFFNYRP